MVRRIEEVDAQEEVEDGRSLFTALCKNILIMIVVVAFGYKILQLLMMVAMQDLRNNTQSRDLAFQSRQNVFSRSETMILRAYLWRASIQKARSEELLLVKDVFNYSQLEVALSKSYLIRLTMEEVDEFYEGSTVRRHIS